MTYSYNGWLVFRSRDEMREGLLAQDKELLVDLILCQEDIIYSYDRDEGKFKAHAKDRLRHSLMTGNNFNFTSKAAERILGKNENGNDTKSS
jgi:hypothetical protein